MSTHTIELQNRKQNVELLGPVSQFRVAKESTKTKKLRIQYVLNLHGIKKVKYNVSILRMQKSGKKYRKKKMTFPRLGLGLIRQIHVESYENDRID